MRLKEALTDVYSAATVQYMNGFINSDAYKQIIPDADTRDLLTKRIKTLVDIKRNKQFTKKSHAKLNKTLNRLATIGTGRVLGGIAQFPKQLIPPIINTISQAGGINMLKGFGMMFNPSVNKFLDNSGMSIANRGVQSQTALEAVNRKLEANLEGNLQKGLGFAAKPNEFLLKGLVKGDKFAARASWMAYYLQGLQNQGVNTSGINWDTHQMNQEAANFAQQQVDRNQNVSDPDLQGEIFTSKNPGAVFTRKAVLPFATFILNQKTRMVNDIRALTSKTASISEKGDAARSLTGLLTEQAAFHSMGYFITNMLTGLAYDLMDEFEPAEEEEKRKKNMFKGKMSTVVKDFASPIPPLDDITASVINAITNSIFEEENYLELFANDKKTFLQQIGVMGIPADKASNLWEFYSIAKDGKYTDNYGKERQVPFVAQKTVKELMLPYLLYNVGLLPTEAGSVIERAVKVAKKAKEKPMEIREQKLGTTSQKELDNTKTTVEDRDLGSDFKSKKGSLISPVEQGSIKTPFGKNRDAKYPNVTRQNSGVDIATEEKSDARSVSSGKVSKIQKFKDGTTAVYVRHGDYITVYKNISNPKVKVGQVVDEEQPLGTVFTNPKTRETVLKFLVYDKDKKQNPQEWVTI
jgi:murein DD-endopeptidase MepM/ murein hydrolase activator NlpD